MYANRTPIRNPLAISLTMGIYLLLFCQCPSVLALGDCFELVEFYTVSAKAHGPQAVKDAIPELLEVLRLDAARLGEGVDFLFNVAIHIELPFESALPVSHRNKLHVRATRATNLTIATQPLRKSAPLIGPEFLMRTANSGLALFQCIDYFLSYLI